MVYRAEGIAGRLAVANEFAVDSSLLHAQMVAQYLIKTLQANTFRFFFLILSNLGSAPDALDQEVRLGSFAFFHSVKLLDPHYDLISARLNEG